MDTDEEEHEFSFACDCESCRLWYIETEADHAVQDELDERETQP
jgi:hypothetical protein